MRTMTTAVLVCTLLATSALQDGTDPSATDAAMNSTKGQPVTQPIDDSLFVGHGPDVRQFSVDATIEAPVGDVYRGFTDGDAFRIAFAPENEALRANIDLAIGGRYEWLFDGETGSNGCQVLSYLPDRMVSFSWSAPPSQPESRAKLTWVVVEFQAVGDDATHVTINHLGFGPEPHWDETYEYFQNAWPYVLEQFGTHLAAK